jgi:SAM-dependent methyltransferase
MQANRGCGPRPISVPNLLAIFGLPGSGKSTLARAISKSSGFLYLKSDPIFSSHIAPNLANWEDFIAFRDQQNEHFSVSRYVDSACYDHTLFVAFLKEELRRILQASQSVHTVLLDGYVFKHYSKIFSDLGFSAERTLALHVSKVNDRHMVESFDVTGHSYDAVLKHIRESFSLKCLNTTLPKSKYQNFISLGLSCPDSRNPDSDTFAKYTASHLEDVVHPSDRIVDIGCNAGYFCFQVASKTNGGVIGIDIALNSLEVASHINNSIFLHRNITFYRTEALEFLSENPDSFEIIHCASTYHYFRERQIVFLRQAHRALTSSGTLILEVELSNTIAGPEIAKRARGVDSSPCAFPNRAMFQQQISGLFTIAAEFDSVFQKGSFYDRVYFHLRPVGPAVRGLADSALPL